METLILIPGLGSDAAVWQRTIDALGDAADCQVGDTLSDDSLTGMAQRILASAPEQFSLAGVSMGGMVALQIMRLAPERVTRLALFDTNARPDTPEQTAQRERTNAAMLQASDLAVLAPLSFGYLIHPDAGQDVRDALVAMTVRVGAEAYVRQNRAVVARPDARPILPAIKVPTLVAIGGQDVMTPLEMSQEIAGAIPGAVLQVIPDCGHLPPIEKPEAVAALLKDWLGQ